jgi:hypothetical protein
VRHAAAAGQLSPNIGRQLPACLTAVSHALGSQPRTSKSRSKNYINLLCPSEMEVGGREGGRERERERLEADQKIKRRERQ